MGNIEDGIPGERLQAGERFSVGFAPAEREGSRKMGTRFKIKRIKRVLWYLAV